MLDHQSFLFQLDSQLNFEILFSRLVKQFGFVYLENNLSPFFGLFPKKLWVQTEKFNSQCRQDDFSYLCDSNQSNINFNETKHTNNSSDFTGGYIGFISYNYSNNQFIQSKKIGYSPSFILGEYDIFIKQEKNLWYLHVPLHLKQHPFILNFVQQLNLPTKPNHPCKFKYAFQPRWHFSQYQKAFEQVQDYLKSGDCYQINLTQEFSSKLVAGSLSQLMGDLRQLTKAPYAGYLAFEDFELLSCSPELFIEFTENRLLKTRPIKGTLPRGSNSIEDEQLKQQLANSEKDQAENLMIVDLLRNDLSVYAETGSVKVPKLFEIESFAQVHHMVSEIHATLKPEVNPFDVLMSALPGGSITGAPKIRAMEIIDEIEGNQRGAYCGSLGYFNYDGTGRFNILIRSIQRYGDDVSIWAGGGITIASDVDAEYQETLDKVSAILDVLNQYAEQPST